MMLSIYFQSYQELTFIGLYEGFFINFEKTVLKNGEDNIILS